MSKLASLCSRVAQGSFPKALLTFRWARVAFVKPFVGVPVLVGGARLESTGRQGRGPLGTGSVPAAPALGTAPPELPLPALTGLALACAAARIELNLSKITCGPIPLLGTDRLRVRSTASLAALGAQTEGFPITEASRPESGTHFWLLSFVSLVRRKTVALEAWGSRASLAQLFVGRASTRPPRRSGWKLLKGEPGPARLPTGAPAALLSPTRVLSA